jgi:hypothetical protein
MRRNEYSLLLENKRRAGIPLLDLTTANPTEALADYPHKNIAHVYGALSDFRYEPEPCGTPLARKAIAGWYAAQKISIPAAQIALTASTSEAYSVLFKLLCNPGDEILIPSPSYPLFEYLAAADAVKTAPYRLDYDGSWFVDLDSVQNAISTRTRAIVVVNPNNPTGSFLKDRETTELESLAQRHGLALISDEVFMTYPASPPSDHVTSLIGRNDVLTFSLNGLSKTAGMPQMKLAWIAVKGPPSELDSVFTRLELLLDSYLSVSTPVQQALPGLLRIGAGIHAQIASRLDENRQTLSTLAGSPIEPLASEAGWSAILQIPNTRPEQEWITRLLNDGIVVQPGYFYDMAKEAYIIVSLITPPTDFALAVEHLKRVVEAC